MNVFSLIKLSRKVSWTAFFWDTCITELAIKTFRILPCAEAGWPTATWWSTFLAGQ